jgi:ABC-2 type transport system permease protein
MNFYCVLALVLREIVRFSRYKARVISTLITPLILLAFLGLGLTAAFPNTAMPFGKNYFEYFFPGSLVLTLLFSSIFSSISIIEDRQQGFLQGVMVAPVSRLAIVLGKILGSAVFGLFQSLLILAIGPLSGIEISFSSFVIIAGILSVLSLLLSSLGFLFAWKLNSVQAFHSVMNLVLMPLWLTSGAFFPNTALPEWAQPLFRLNPLSYGFVALKSALYSNEPALLNGFVLSLAWSGVFLGLSYYLVNRASYQEVK